VRPDAHEEAQELIALGADLSDAQQIWLWAHLQECATCRDYAEVAHRVVRVLRSLPVVADPRLVEATQMRVRFHASRLREMRERMWLVGMACLGVGLSASLTVPLLWRLFEWMAAWAGVSKAVWQTGFACFLIAPAVVVSVLLLARGTDLANLAKESRQLR
jgi:predicted anti-sigma-YlaC factor YlaD